MENVTFGQIAILVLGAAGFWTLLGKMFDAWEEKRKRKRDKNDKDVDQTAAIARLNVTAEEHTKQLSLLQTGVMFLVYDRFEHLVERYISIGSLTMKQLNIISSLYNSYKDLGGDGFADDLMERVKELPIEYEKVA